MNWEGQPPEKKKKKPGNSHTVCVIASPSKHADFDEIWSAEVL